jgi:hypothetical protein
MGLRCMRNSERFSSHMIGCARMVRVEPCTLSAEDVGGQAGAGAGTPTRTPLRERDFEKFGKGRRSEFILIRCPSFQFTRSTRRVVQSER